MNPFFRACIAGIWVTALTLGLALPSPLYSVEPPLPKKPSCFKPA